MVDVKKVSIVEPFNIDQFTIRRDSYFPNAYVIDFPLDSEPDHVWQDMFEAEWRTSRHLWDRKVFIIGDLLRLVTSPNNIEEKIGWVRGVVSSTNKRIESYNKNAVLTLQTKPEMRHAAIDHDETLERIRTALRKSFF